MFSLVICTRNRSQLLADAVSSAQAQEFPVDRYEIIVVDNASTDDTSSVRRRPALPGEPPLRYVYEPHLGLAYARNAGARAARGDIVAYVDDDAVADPGWLAALARAFEEDERVVSVGGRIDLLWDRPRPAWLSEQMDGYLGCNHHLGDVKRDLPAPLYPFGGNIAVRRDVLEEAGLFEPEFGHVGATLGALEEARLTDRLRAFGRVVFTPEALVYHRVLPERLNCRYFLRRGYYQGRADALLDQMRSPRSRFGLLRSVGANLLFLGGDVVRVLGSWLRRDRKHGFARLVFATSRLGRLVRTAQLVLGEREPTGKREQHNARG